MLRGLVEQVESGLCVPELEIGTCFDQVDLSGRVVVGGVGADHR